MHGPGAKAERRERISTLAAFDNLVEAIAAASGGSDGIDKLLVVTWGGVAATNHLSVLDGTHNLVVVTDNE